MAELQTVAPDLWAVATPHAFIGLHIGSRMSVVRLPDGSLLLHSPVPIDDALAAELAALGPVSHIVCPNLFHHLFAAEVLARYPQAQLHGPAKLARKRRDLHFTGELSETPHPDWQPVLELHTIAGSLLNETVFYHRPSATLIASDLIENFHHCEHGFTRWYLKLGGILGKPGWHPLLRLVYLNRRKARASVEQILQWPFQRLVLAHGEIITENAREQVVAGMAWLRVRLPEQGGASADH